MGTLTNRLAPWHVKLSAGIGLVLFVLFGLYEPILHGLPGDVDRSIAISYMVISALAPWYFVTKVPVGPMQIFAVHTTFTDHALRWLVFSLASAAIWFVVLRSLDRLRRRGGLPSPPVLTSLALGLSPLLDAAYIVGLAVVHKTSGLSGPWDWLTQVTGWPGQWLVELIAGPTWLPVVPYQIPLAEHLAHWGLYLVLNVSVWVLAGGAARALLERRRRAPPVQTGS